MKNIKEHNREICCLTNVADYKVELKNVTEKSAEQTHWKILKNTTDNREIWGAGKHVDKYQRTQQTIGKCAAEQTLLTNIKEHHRQQRNLLDKRC